MQKISWFLYAEMMAILAIVYYATLWLLFRKKKKGDSL